MVEVVKLFSLRIEGLMKTEKEFTFPLFMRLIRRKLSLSRNFVASTLGCSPQKVYYVERGVYGNRGPEIEFILALAEFYGLDIAFIIKKFREYMLSPERKLTEDSQQRLDAKKIRKDKKIADQEKKNDSPKNNN